MFSPTEANVPEDEQDFYDPAKVLYITEGWQRVMEHERTMCSFLRPRERDVQVQHPIGVF